MKVKKTYEKMCFESLKTRKSQPEEDWRWFNFSEEMYTYYIFQTRIYSPMFWACLLTLGKLSFVFNLEYLS